MQHTRLASFYFAYFMVLGAFAPYFSPYLEARGLDPGQLSVLMSLWYGTRVFAPPLWNLWLRQVGHGERWLLLGCLLTLLGFALFLLPLSFAWLLLAMLLFASFYNAVMPQFEAITLEQLGAQRQRYGRVRLWGSVGFLVANLGYGWLLQQVGYAQLVIWMMPCFGLLVACAWLNRRRDLPTAATSLRPLPDSPSTPPTPLAGPLAIAALMQVCHAPFYVYLSLFLAEHGWQAGSIGLAWASGVLAEVWMFTRMGALLARFPVSGILGCCLLAGTLRWSLLAQFPGSAGVVFGTQLLHALTFAAFHAGLMMWISGGRHGAALASAQAWLYGLGSGGGGVIGALLAGWTWQHLGHAETFELAALLSLLTVAVLWSLATNRRRKARP